MWFKIQIHLVDKILKDIIIPDRTILALDSAKFIKKSMFLCLFGKWNSVKGILENLTIFLFFLYNPAR